MIERFKARAELKPSEIWNISNLILTWVIYNDSFARGKRSRVDITQAESWNVKFSSIQEYKFQVCENSDRRYLGESICLSHGYSEKS